MKLLEIEKEACLLLSQCLTHWNAANLAQQMTIVLSIDEVEVAKHRQTYYRAIHECARGPTTWMRHNEQDVFQIFTVTDFWFDEDATFHDILVKVSENALTWCGAVKTTVENGFSDIIYVRVMVYMCYLSRDLRYSIVRMMIAKVSELDKEDSVVDQIILLENMLSYGNESDNKSLSEKRSLLDRIHSELVSAFGDDAPIGFKDRFLATYVMLLLTTKMDEIADTRASSAS